MIELINKYLNSKDYIRSQYVRRKVLKIPEGKLKPLLQEFHPKKGLKVRSNSVVEQ